ncbi:ribose/galactose ABC transporter permease [Spiroplasma syrphidicola EA-1]|uniref:Ribose/galactose ABC transporter permease n=1 Tax=Spiroplasma syrphidicola EA-1 TaxID=1276229 RepID=R4UK50_9MOLU|nr:ABC transporter permease [Spiroplasma syrphidicola]AGM25641.1 ribose/galactose ABC transporter permease [Spiroplasma syrphidicola EA-1]
MGAIEQLFANASVLFAVLLIAAMAGLYSERAGIVNIAIDGMMIIGALTYALLGKMLSQYGNGMQLIALLGAGLVGGLFALLHGFATITLKSQQIISGVAINLLATGLGLFFVSIPSLAVGNMIKTGFTIIGIDNAKIINIFVIIAVILAIFTFVFFYFTKAGTRFAACGENPHAIDAAGISVVKIRYTAVIISGVLASIAGAMFTHFLSNQFRGDVQGQGYIALAIMIFGQWRIQYITLGAVLFSFLIALASSLWRFAGWNIADPSNQLLKILPFVFALVTMVAFSKYSKVPKASGIPFDKGAR